MALVTCPDCEAEISDKAPACPRCGRPLSDAGERAAATEKPTTIEQTAKTYKAHQFVGALILIVGVLAGIAGDGSSAGPGIMIAVGLVWFIAARIGAWWGHG